MEREAQVLGFNEEGLLCYDESPLYMITSGYRVYIENEDLQKAYSSAFVHVVPTVEENEEEDALKVYTRLDREVSVFVPKEHLYYANHGLVDREYEEGAIVYVYARPCKNELYPGAWWKASYLGENKVRIDLKPSFPEFFFEDHEIQEHEEGVRSVDLEVDPINIHSPGSLKSFPIDSDDDFSESKRLCECAEYLPTEEVTRPLKKRKTEEINKK